MRSTDVLFPWGQFFLLSASIFIAPNLSPRNRFLLGGAYLALAAVAELLQFLRRT